MRSILGTGTPIPSVELMMDVLLDGGRKVPGVSYCLILDYIVLPMLLVGVIEQRKKREECRVEGREYNKLIL